MPEAVLRADHQLLATEARDLMGPAPAPWSLPEAALPERIQPWPAEQAERAFLESFQALSAR